MYEIVSCHPIQKNTVALNGVYTFMDGVNFLFF